MDHLITDLLERQSVSPEDAGCQEKIASILRPLGFEIEALNHAGVQNVWAKKSGKGGKVFLWAGHTDVVPPGLIQQWQSNPFQPTVREGYLYARGAADMKVALACMVLATKQFIEQYPSHQGSIAFLITSCEEETTDYGSNYAIDILCGERQEKIDWFVVGEPSSQQAVADQIKIGRRGSLSGKLTVIGKQGHIAYPHLAANPIHLALAALDECAQYVWDTGSEYFSPTSFQISNIQAGTGATNVIPGELIVDFNFRYSPEQTADSLKQTVEAILRKHGLQYRIVWSHSGLPFLSQPGELVTAVETAIKQIAGRVPVRSTTGGTSDARFIAPYGIEVVELGFCGKTIHQIDECVAINDIPVLQQIYYQIMCSLLL